MSTSDHDELSTVMHGRFDPSEAPTRSYRLTVLHGDDAGRSATLGGQGVLALSVGTSPSVDFVLRDRTLSRRHASFEVGAQLRLRDLGSSNGTFVQDVRVVEALLEGGEHVRLGSTLLRVERLADAPGPELPGSTHFGRLLGASREMRRLYPLLARVAASDVPVLIEGETGTGKEVLAEAIHEQGARASRPFVVFDCTAVPSSLVDSELFGHERGAFTGAVGSRPGVFEQAHGGTLFIDEIGDLDLAVQPKLLRALERSAVKRLGAADWRQVDVRVVAATRRNLDEEVEAGRFRDDLYHRLVVARVELPPLRERRGDVALLVHGFVQQLGGAPGAIPPEVVARWGRQAWPGNVRELRNAVARYLALGDAPPGVLGALESRPLTEWAREAVQDRIPLTRARQLLVESFERSYIEHVLEAHGGNVSRAAAASGIARRYFQILRARSGDAPKGPGEPE